MILIEDYFDKITSQLSRLPNIIDQKIEKKKINNLYYGIISGSVKMENDIYFEFLEVMNTHNNPDLKKNKYKYHLMKDDNLIFRYDNAPHHPEIESFPHHKHLEGGKIISCSEPDIHNIVLEIVEVYKSR